MPRRKFNPPSESDRAVTVENLSGGTVALPPTSRQSIAGTDRITHSDKQRFGEKSSALAKELMGLSESDFARLKLDDGIRRDVEAARRISTPIARKRAERRLAGILRTEGLAEIGQVITAHNETKRSGARQFQLIEKIREKILNGDDTAISIVVQDPTTGQWPTLVDEARREAAKGKPKGAKKRLFRALADAREQQLADAGAEEAAAAPSSPSAKSSSSESDQ